MASFGQSQYSLNNSTRYVLNKNDRWSQLDRRLEQRQFIQKHEIPVLGSFKNSYYDGVEDLRSKTKQERQKMGPIDHRRNIVSENNTRGRRRNVCGSVTDSLY